MGEYTLDGRGLLRCGQCLLGGCPALARGLVGDSRHFAHLEPRHTLVQECLTGVVICCRITRVK